MDSFAWVDKEEEQRKKNSPFFEMEEGDNRFALLSHCAPLSQVYEGGKYRPAVEGDTNVSIKGVCYVYQDKRIKEAKLPYLAVKAIRALQQNPDWEFAIPFPHVLTLNAIGAGMQHVKYSLTASPKMITIPEEILTELAKRPTPEDVVERIKGVRSVPKEMEYPDGPDPESIPF